VFLRKKEIPFPGLKTCRALVTAQGSLLSFELAGKISQNGSEYNEIIRAPPAGGHWGMDKDSDPSQFIQ